MHKLTALQIEELKRRLHTDRGNLWMQTAETMNARGLFASGPHVNAVIDTGLKVAEELINKSIGFERTALSHEPTKPPMEYFDDMKEELMRFAESELAVVRSKAVSVSESRGSAIREDALLKIQHQEVSMRESISRQVDILQEELRLGIARLVQGTTIHVEGDVGAINTGTIFGSIQGKVEKLREMHQEELANAINRLADAVQQSKLPEEAKCKQLERVEFLATQAELPPDRRNSGVIEAIQSSLSAAANLAAIWQQVGPIIMKFLGI